MKKCTFCLEVFVQKHFSQEYCSDDCKRITGNKNRQRGRTFKNSFSTHEEYTAALLEMAKNSIIEAYHTTPKGFDTVCDFSYRTYTNLFRGVSWYEIMKKIGYGEMLKQYISSEYQKYIRETGNESFRRFCEEHTYITYELALPIGNDVFYKEAGILKSRYTLKDLEVNFRWVRSHFDDIPLYNEFIRLSKITISSYENHLGLKGEIYENILRQYCSMEEMKAYRLKRKLHKSQIGRETGKLSLKYSIDDFDKEFHRVTMLVEERYGGYLTKRLFDKLSKFSERTFRKKLQLAKWTEICSHYNYKLKTWNLSELAALNLIATITKHPFIHQHKFDWLINGDGNHLPSDGYFEELNLVVEFDGAQHRTPIKA